MLKRISGRAGLFALGLFALAVLAMPARAEEPEAATAPTTTAGALPPERIVRPMRAVDPVTLRAEGVNIRLWGIKPAGTSETPLELRALDLMDSLIREQQVNCKIISGRLPELTGRCMTAANQDLALSLLAEGFVVVDRKQTYNSVLASGYERTQEAARLKAKGIWRFVAEDAAGKPAFGAETGGVLLLAVFLGPLLGLCLVAVVMYAALRRIAVQQDRAVEDSRHKEAALQQRERHVLLSTLEGEVLENKNKIEAFLTIYRDMRRSLQDASETPKYQQSGDIVQKHPIYSRTVFEANVANLSLLDMKVAGAVSKLYSAFPENAQEYINLEPDVPLNTVVDLINKVLADTEHLLPQMDQVLHMLRAEMAS